MQVKGRVAFASFLVRKTPLGKAVREKKMLPKDEGFHKILFYRDRCDKKKNITKEEEHTFGGIRYML